MSSIAQNQGNGQRKISATLKSFYGARDTGVAAGMPRGEAQRGIGIRDIPVSAVFGVSDRSMYMRMITGRSVEGSTS